MKTLKILTTAILMATLLTGCAIKKTDTMTQKVAKHTANAPIYVVAGTGAALVGAGAIIQKGIIGAITVPVYLTNKLSGSNKKDKEIKVVSK